ncbi:MAG: hypothetical protein FWE32_04865 [Oscillospiraceae bacterium]|nr:hypothetical protein [Oscillospiraceae bacterium]
MDNQAIYSHADSLTANRDFFSADQILTGSKERSGKTKKELRQLFKNRLTDDQITQLLMSAPPDSDVFSRCTEIRRLSLKQLKIDAIYCALFKSLQQSNT